MFAYGCLKTRLSESREDAEERTSHIPELNIVIGLFFCFCFQLQQLGFYRFLPDHECNGHKWNRCSASDSIGFILTRFYRSVLLIMTLIMTLNTKKRLSLLPYATQLGARMNQGVTLALARSPRWVSKVLGEHKSSITCPFGEYDFHCQEII